jgi:hypothetical protein
VTIFLVTYLHTDKKGNTQFVPGNGFMVDKKVAVERARVLSLTKELNSGPIRNIEIWKVDEMSAELIVPPTDA